MNNEQLELLISKWEPDNCEVIRTIDSQEGTIERIVKHGIIGDHYSLFRYFELGFDSNARLVVSVDLDHVDADRVIQHLAERI